MTLAHLVCVLNPSSCVQLLTASATNPDTSTAPWTIKDNEGKRIITLITLFSL